MVPGLPMAHDVRSSVGSWKERVLVWQRGIIFFTLFLQACASYGNTLQGENLIELHRSAPEGWNVLSTPLQPEFRGRSLQQVMENGSQLILAAARTARKDPLDSFSVYRGGWNIRSSHYWASVSVTATPVWIWILVWVFIAILILLTSCISACCCRRGFGDGVKPLSTCSSFLWLGLLAFFTAVCIAGCILLYVTAVASNRSLTSTLHVVDDEAAMASGTLRNVAQQLNSLQNNSFVQKYVNALDPTALGDLQSATDKANSAANAVESKEHSNSDKIKSALSIIRIITIIISAVTLLLSLIGFLLLLLGWTNLVFTMVIVGWVLLTCVWILTGTGILVANVAQDTCVAMSDWLSHPAASTTMDDILPCTDLSATSTALSRSKLAVKSIVVKANNYLSAINKNAPAQGKPQIPTICDPYGNDPPYQTVPCPTDTVDISTAYQALQAYVPTPINEADYQQLGSAAESVQALITLSGNLTDLTNCSNVRSAMTRITRDHCPSLHRNLRGQWIGLLVLSASASIILIIWLLYALKQRAAHAYKLHGAYTDNEKGAGFKKSILSPRLREGPIPPRGEDGLPLRPGAPPPDVYTAGPPPKPLQQQMPGAYVGTGPSKVPFAQGGGDGRAFERPPSPFRPKRVQPTVPPYEG